MAKTLDFNKVKKQYLTVKLADEDQTTLLITTPTKKTLEEFIGIRNLVTNSDNADVMDEFYDITAKIMSHNLNKKQITKEYIESNFDFEDIIIFIQAYTEFIQEITNQKN